MLSLKLFCVVVLLKLAAARYAFMPKFVPDESRVNSDKPLPVVPLEPYNPLAYYRLVHQYPAYHIIPPMKKTKLTMTPGSSSTTTTTSSTTTVVPDTQDEFPSDLLEIAQRKLGIKRLEEIPTITELGQLLGTSGAEETLKYIRQLTSTDQGIALMKAYIESADYTDSMGSNSNNTDENGSDADDDDEDDDNDDDENKDDDNDDEPTMKDKNDLVVVDSVSKPSPVAPKPGFLERMSEYLSIYNLWPQQQKAIEATQKYQPKFIRKPQAPVPVPASQANTNVIHKPMLVRNPLPYHYPIPLRPLLLPGQARVQTNAFAKTPLVHLNTPKAMYAPHIQQLAKMAKISPQHLDSFLQNKPKLAALAAKVSRLPVSHETASLIDAQLLAAVGRAVEEDEDLKKLLSSTDTLK